MTRGSIDGLLENQQPVQEWRYEPDPDRRFAGWYVNLQKPFRRTARGFETMDLMLDLVVEVDRSWWWKDEDELETFVVRPGTDTDIEV